MKAVRDDAFFYGQPVSYILQMLAEARFRDEMGSQERYCISTGRQELFHGGMQEVNARTTLCAVTG